MIIHFKAQGARVAAKTQALARRGVEAVLRHGRVRGRALLCVVWTDRARVRALNRRFRSTNRFTDVIAFRYEEAGSPPFRGDGVPFGDLFIAVPQARLNAARFGVSLHEELVRLSVHGTLHLLGYTDYVPREKKKMWAVQERIIRRLMEFPSPKPRA